MTILALILASLGTILILLAAVGLLRLPDVYMRCHAAGKAATLGVCCTLLAVAVGLAQAGGWVRALISIAFLFVTIPVGTQLVARAAFRNGAPAAKETSMDPNLDRVIPADRGADDGN
jgi:multicomponent Na+:H+ antiporter subunit G